MVGLDDLRILFQPMILEAKNDSIIIEKLGTCICIPDHLLLVIPESRDSLQLFNCMAHISPSSVIFPLFSSLSFQKSARHL